MSGSLDSAANAEPNLTPVLDMVFQLITFFMLVINFKSAELDLNLKLPVVGSAKPVDTQGQQDLLVLNINAEGSLQIYGQSRDIENYIQAEAQAGILKNRLDQDEVFSGKIDLPTTVVLRADREARYGKLSKVIVACQKYGFRSFALRAMNREE